MKVLLKCLFGHWQCCYTRVLVPTSWEIGDGDGCWVFSSAAFSVPPKQDF